MKEIPCAYCGQAALGPPTPANPRGEPIQFGRYTGNGGRPIVLKCHRCGRAFKLNALMFNSLPTLREDH